MYSEMKLIGSTLFRYIYEYMAEQGLLFFVLQVIGIVVIKIGQKIDTPLLGEPFFLFFHQILKKNEKKIIPEGCVPKSLYTK